MSRIGRSFAALAVLAGCSQSVVSEVSTSRRHVGASPFASATAQPAASRAPPAASAEVPYPTYPRTGAPGSTNKTISCGHTRCDASKHACNWDTAAGQWACVSPPLPQEDESELSSHPYLVRCDDASDCPAGQRCCRHADNYSVFAAQCAPTDDVDVCASEICDEGAACPAGTTCVLGARGSVDDSVDPEGHQGTCEPPKGPATCAGKSRCPADRPVCVLSKKGPTCVAPESETSLRARPRDLLGCTLQSDCKGEQVCSYGLGETLTLGTYCARWIPGLGGTVVCDPGGPRERKGTAAEKARFCSRKNCPECDNERCRQSIACSPGKLLPWLGTLGWH